MHKGCTTFRYTCSTYTEVGDWPNTANSRTFHISINFPMIFFHATVCSCQKGRWKFRILCRYQSDFTWPASINLISAPSMLCAATRDSQSISIDKLPLSAYISIGFLLFFFTSSNFQPIFFNLPVPLSHLYSSSPSFLVRITSVFFFFFLLFPSFPRLSFNSWYGFSIYISSFRIFFFLAYFFNYNTLFINCFLSVCLSLSVCLHLSINLSIYLSICLPIPHIYIYIYIFTDALSFPLPYSFLKFYFQKGINWNSNSLSTMSPV